jgi:hypothetical protein
MKKLLIGFTLLTSVASFAEVPVELLGNYESDGTKSEGCIIESISISANSDSLRIMNFYASKEHGSIEEYEKINKDVVKKQHKDSVHLHERYRNMDVIKNTITINENNISFIHNFKRKKIGTATFYRDGNGLSVSSVFDALTYVPFEILINLFDDLKFESERTEYKLTRDTQELVVNKSHEYHKDSYGFLPQDYPGTSCYYNKVN